MIILLTGPTGVGKTDTSWAMIGQSRRLVFLDCDWFASYTPFSWQQDADVESVYEALSLMVSFHLRRGANRFVIPLTIEMAFSFAHHRHHLAQHGLPLLLFRLRCSDEILRERILERDRIEPQKQAELAGAWQAQRNFDQLPSAFTLLDTSRLTIGAVASIILEAAAKEKTARSEPPFPP